MTMLKKIDRQECLDKFSTFPLREYDKKKDEEVFYYPNINSLYWLKLQADTEIQLKKKIAAELVSLYRELGIDRLTFLCDFNSTWITKNSKNRTDYKQLINAVKYLRDNKVTLKFNGGITVDIAHLKEFLEHFIILTRCDASFSYYHFINDDEDLIGYIHYDGEVRFDTLNNKANDRFLKAIKKTTFEDTGRENLKRSRY
ncbi:hypothetical protein [Sphingobacterium bambusae]|nr:hypothetical protein [Sphingobacterium bambusae]WPL49300.1 hypothetical protein SCB77_02370 [Sphingobacterium bambusae]